MIKFRFLLLLLWWFLFCGVGMLAVCMWLNMSHPWIFQVSLGALCFDLLAQDSLTLLQGSPSFRFTRTNTQIQIHKYSCTNTHTQVEIHKYTYTNTHTHTQIFCFNSLAQDELTFIHGSPSFRSTALLINANHTQKIWISDYQQNSFQTKTFFHWNAEKYKPFSWVFLEIRSEAIL